MKKITVIGIAICMAFMLITPAMATTDIEMTGYYRVHGYSSDNLSLLPNGTSSSFFTDKLRVQTVLKINDNLKVVTRFDAFDNRVWGTPDESQVLGDKVNIDWDRAYMEMITKIGFFRIGRQKGNAWGTSFADQETDRDRILYAVPLDNLILAFVYEKMTETDAGTTVNDADFDRFYLTATYKAENYTAGLLTAFLRINDQPITSTILMAGPVDIDLYEIAPYIIGKFGPISIEAELLYGFGTAQRDGAADSDVKMWGFYGEGGYDFGPFGLQAGVALGSGDNDGFGPGSDIESALLLQDSGDWDKLFLLSDKDGGVLGGFNHHIMLGPNTGNFQVLFAQIAGFEIFYLSGYFAATDNITIEGIIAQVNLMDPMAAMNDDFGMEYDISLTWNIYKNLKYKAVVAVFEPGDYFGATADSNTTFFNELELSF
ncbi:MAG: hypothetical protein HN931_01285 [Desulfobacterales bacterium]|jgi:hypothetical protein|nr:hypothetical protein [Desulfobacteraceae bacterium]MBT7084788.1 hypothetical protein [Desulfobacterales bacterium]